MYNIECERNTQENHLQISPPSAQINQSTVTCSKIEVSFDYNGMLCGRIIVFLLFVTDSVTEKSCRICSRYNMSVYIFCTL